VTRRAHPRGPTAGLMPSRAHDVVDAQQSLKPTRRGLTLAGTPDEPKTVIHPSTRGAITLTTSPGTAPSDDTIARSPTAARRGGRA